MANNWPRLSLADSGVSLIDCEHRTPPSNGSGLPYVAIPQIKHGRLDLSDVRLISPDHFLQWTRKAKPQAFDVILSRRCNPGETAVVPPGLECALGQNLVLLRADNTRMHPPFLRWLVRSPEWWDQVGKFLNVGAVFDSLKCADIPNFQLYVPSLPEQRRIAELLGTLDDKIELNHRTNETLEAICRAAFKNWFIDFNPVRTKAALRCRHPHLSNAELSRLALPDFDPAIAEVFPDAWDDSTIGPIPRNWHVADLGSHLTYLETGSRPKGGVAHITDGIPSVGAESIVGLGRFDFSKTKYVSRDYFAAMRRGHVCDRDILLYKDGGRPGIYEPHLSMVGSGFPFDEFCINEHVYRLRSAKPLCQSFLYFWLTSELVLDEMRTKGTGVAIPGLNSTAVKSLTLLVPDASVTNAFEQFAEPLIATLFRNCNESRDLAVTRDALLPKLLSGELSVINHGGRT